MSVLSLPSFLEPGGSGAESPGQRPASRRGRPAAAARVSGGAFPAGPATAAVGGGPPCSLDGGLVATVTSLLRGQGVWSGAWRPTGPRCDKLPFPPIPINTPLSHGVIVTKSIAAGYSLFNGCRGGSWGIFLGEERRA